MGAVGRQIIPFLVLVAIAGCADFSMVTDREPPRGTGAIVADEPRAVLVARETLEIGGNAADAAVALYFALSVTYPSSAGLGGGGVCVARRAPSDRDGRPRAETLDFTSRNAGSAAPAGLEPVGIPANARGMYALHARYGRLPWAEVVRPAESLARFGTQVSRAFAAELAKGIDRFAGDPRGADIFRRPDGSPLREGDHLKRIDLAGVLGQIRMRGPGVFYSGGLARTIEEGARESGAYLTVEDLRGFVPSWTGAVERSYGRYTVFFPAGNVTGGVVASELWKALFEDDGYGSADRASRDSVIIKTAERVLSENGVPMRGIVEDASGPADPAVTGFAVMDGRGGAVACAVSLNGRFGSGRLIRGTGIVASAPPGGPADARSAFAPMVVASRHTATVIAAAAPSGNASAPTALISVALRLLRDDEAIQHALGAARAFPGLADKTIYVEQRNAGPVRLTGLADHRRIAVSALGRVNLIYCADGLPRAPGSCVFGTDPRGFGYAVDAQPVTD